MASGRIRGITIEIDGDTKKLNSALKDVDSQLSTTKSALKDVEKLLKLDPDNVELLDQKQRLLNEAIEATKERLETLKGAFSDNMSTEEVDALNREIIETEQSLEAYEAQASAAAGASGDLADQTEDAADATEEANTGWSESKQILADLAKEGLDKAADAAKKLGKYITGAIGESAEYADEILTMSKKYNMSTESLQEFAYMSELVDTDLGTITGSITKLTKQMGAAADGNEAAAEKFAELEIDIYNADGTLKSADTVFLEAIDALGQMESGVERDNVAMELFGKSAQELNPLIETGSAGIAAYAQEAHDMGAVLDEEALGSLGEMDDSMQRVDQATTALKNTIGVALAPVITQIAEGIANLSKWFQSLDTDTQQTIVMIAGLAAAIVPAIAIVTKIIGVVQGLSTVFSALSMGPAALVVAAIAAIIAIGVTLYKHWDEIKEWAGKLWDGIKETFGKIKDGIVKAWNSVKEKTKEAWNNISSAVSEKWNSIKEKASETWENMKEAAANSWSAMKKNIEDNGGGIEGFIKSVGQNYVEAWRGAWNTIDSATGGKLTAIKDKVEGILNSIKDKFQGKFDAIKNFVSNTIDSIKNFFSNLRLELPHIKLPHFSLTGTFSLNPPSIPKLSVDWYKQAYNNPVMFTNPTVIPTVNGYKGFGDGSGAEIVIGLNRLQDLVGSQGNVTNNITIIQQPGQSTAQLADMVARRIQQNVERQKAVMG